MRLSDHVTPLRPRVVAGLLRHLLPLLAAVHAVPAAVAAAGGEWTGAAVHAAVAACAWGAGRGRRPPPAELRRAEALAATALAYPLFAAAGALPLLRFAPPADAVLEAFSAFTTTGLTVVDLDALPFAARFFRAWGQWVGGAGIVVLSLALLIGPGRTPFRLYATEYRGEHALGNVRATARAVLRAYGALTAVAALAYLLAGAVPADAVLLALSTLSTGGFTPHRDGIAACGGPAVAVVAAVCMLLGAMPLVRSRGPAAGHPRARARDEQTRALLGVAAVAVAVAVLGSWLTGQRGGAAAFHAVSALTTTGFDVGAPADWPAGGRAGAILLMIAGGALGSTAGGIKLYRLLLLGKLVHVGLARLLLPGEARVPVRYGDHAVDDHELRAVLGWVLVYLAVLAASTVALAALGVEVGDALFESASALGTVGLSAGVTAPELPAAGKAVLCGAMWAGRLEIVPVLLILHPYSWHVRRRHP